MDFYNRLAAHINKGNDFAATMGVKITKVAEDCVEGELEIGSHHMNPVGVVHGGCLTTLADTVTGVASYTALKKRCVCVTVNCTMNFLRGATGTKLKCTAKPQRAGRAIAVFDATITDDQDKVVATGCFTYFQTDIPLGM